MGINKLATFDDFSKVKEKTDRFLLFKNSTTCPISSQAFEEFEKFAEDHDHDVYYLNVQEARPLSNDIAETYGVKHQSPQALLIDGDHVVWNDSHWRITYSSLADAVKK
ncbi:bacillithiol system redox-active protein YtxJ [Guptibacillus algicola]|uniref:bacillithiol system redox-active protein YtxJ n=1 Tax=Guptibacillus algicola TaxID=225844 RepID=UPI001CD5F8E8|nr:bacillithiol system redox-active protein YtxJ [Alkalihalobacillus algicola]MCA0986386.1 bacillithiol system redox-active protein YtxJ [Alkalihalobacillus algicola]